ncbi:MAG TPA: hypothetical protein VEI02_05365 [Planctomycetota bacterium]|nr:hypothetical protein [Planctomycetota bacterium]
MNLDRLAELTLDRRFDRLSPEDVAALEAALAADPLLSEEAARLERLLDAAPDAGVRADADFAGRLDDRLVEEAEADRARRFRAWLRRAAVAYAGVAAGVLLYALAAGWFAQGPDPELRDRAAQLDLGVVAAPTEPPSGR